MTLGGWKKLVLILVIAGQLTTASHLAVDRIPAADPAPMSFWDVVIQQAGSMLETGGADKFVIMALTVAMGIEGAKATAALWEIPAARRLRKETFEKLKNMKAEYEKNRELYVKYPEIIRETETRNIDLRARLVKAEKEKNFELAELLRRDIDRNQASIDAKRLKVPVIMMAEAIRSLGEAEATFDQHVQTLRSAVAAHSRAPQPAAARANGNGHARKSGAANGAAKVSTSQAVVTAGTAVDRWDQHRRQDYVSEWLESRHGREFAQASGRQWAAEYQQNLAEMNSRVERLATVYNAMVDGYNHLVPAEQTLPRLEPQRSSYGPSLRYFNLEPENPRDASREIELHSIGNNLSSVCDQKLSLLASNVKELSKAHSFRRAYSKQLIHPAGAAVSGLALGGVYAWYHYNKGKTYQEAQKEEATKNKIQEQTDITLAAQFEKEKKGENRLKPFLEASASAFESHQASLEAEVARTFDMRDRSTGKPDLLAQRQKEALELGAEAERTRISQTLERATWEFYTKLSITSFEQVRRSLYNEDQGTRDTILRRDLTLVYRDTLLKLYPNIIDDDAMNQLEPTVIRAMVDQTLETLATKLEEMKKNGKSAPQKIDPNSAPVPGTSAPAVTLPTAVANDDEANRLVSAPSTPVLPPAIMMRP